jgi:hypothetical protein
MGAPLLAVHYGGKTLLLDRVDEHSFSSFGGPLELPIQGPQSLTHIAWLNHNQLKPLGLPHQLLDLPLVHPMRHSGGSLRYSFSREGIQVLELEPVGPSDSWPYAGFPDLLPFYSIEVSSVVTEDWLTFSERAPNLRDEQPAEVVALLAPPQGLGFTLWGRAGDAEGVTLAFECDPSAKTVFTYNVCG